MVHNDLPNLIQRAGSVLVNRWKIGIPLTEPHMIRKETQTNQKIKKPSKKKWNEP
jgi:hypothetical protein